MEEKLAEFILTLNKDTLLIYIPIIKWVVGIISTTGIGIIIYYIHKYHKCLDKDSDFSKEIALEARKKILNREET
ncbi:MAG: hypothetical protein DRG78_06350 [Epsilonproteobacteria bacterium]|nr:MAG: hypothetical protein DRG78_06350 [Campylobacterota bacterium]